MTDAPINPADQNFWNAVGEEADRADSAGANFGQLSITPARYIRWVDRQPVDVTPAEFGALPAAEKSLELLFTVDIRGMNSSLEWQYERKVRPGDKDWHKILKPALAELLGADSMKKGMYSQTLQSINGKYVQADDVPQIKNPEYSTIKIVRIFANKEECFAAYQERFAAGTTPGAPATPATPAAPPLSVPPNYTLETWTSIVPSIKQALQTQDVPTVAAQYQVDPNFVAEIANQP